jgi:hypothetical protein
MYVTGFLIYSALFIYLLYRLTRKAALLSTTELAGAFMFKVSMGCLYGYVYLHYYQGDDTWLFHRQSVEELQKLLREPLAFLKDFTPAEAFAWAGGPSIPTYIQFLEKHILAKTLAIFDFFSGDNYYINVIFFNFILFWGHYWLFKMLVKEFPDKRQPLLLLIFFFPPLVFWLSGIRADGLLLFFLSLLLIHFRRWVYEHKKAGLAWCLPAVLGLLIFRLQVLLVLAPALTAWYISVKFRRHSLRTWLLVYVVAGLVFFATAWVSPARNLPLIVVKKQQDFLALQGTRFQLDSLQPSVTGYVRVLPQAVDNTFFRPFIWEAKGLLQIMTALEVLVCWLLVLRMIIKRDEQWKKQLTDPMLLFFICFGITFYIFIGYTVPFPGTIVRYKALPELLLLTIAVICSKWRFTHRINKKVYI